MRIITWWCKPTVSRIRHLSIKLETPCNQSARSFPWPMQQCRTSILVACFFITSTLLHHLTQPPSATIAPEMNLAIHAFLHCLRLKCHMAKELLLELSTNWDWHLNRMAASTKEWVAITHKSNLTISVVTVIIRDTSRTHRTRNSHRTM